MRSVPVPVGVTLHHRASNDRGFTLVEMAITVLVLGLAMAIAVGGFHSLNADQSLKGTAQSVVGQMTLARARAMSTGTTQTVNFNNSATPKLMYVLDPNSSRQWTLPRGIGFASGGYTSFDFTSDGRASASRYIVLMNDKGLLDTISVETSGLVIAR